MVRERAKGGDWKEEKREKRSRRMFN